MGFRNGSWAKCWGIEPGRGNFTKVRLSISRKNKDTGVYEQEFSGFVMMVGTAHAKSSRLKEGDRIQLVETDVTTTYNKAQGKEYVNYKVFDFNLDNGNGASGHAPANAPAHPRAAAQQVAEDDELPF